MAGETPINGFEVATARLYGYHLEDDQEAVI